MHVHFLHIRTHTHTHTRTHTCIHKQGNLMWWGKKRGLVTVTLCACVRCMGFGLFGQAQLPDLLFLVNINGIHHQSSSRALQELQNDPLKFNSERSNFSIYRTDFISLRKNIVFLPCGVTARTKNIYLFWGCGIEKRGFLAYFGACQAKIPVRGWCKLNIFRCGVDAGV